MGNCVTIYIEASTVDSHQASQRYNNHFVSTARGAPLIITWLRERVSTKWRMKATRELFNCSSYAAGTCDLSLCDHTVRTMDTCLQHWYPFNPRHAARGIIRRNRCLIKNHHQREISFYAIQLNGMVVGWGTRQELPLSGYSLERRKFYEGNVFVYKKNIIIIVPMINYHNNSLDRTLISRSKSGDPSQYYNLIINI